jgi:hypothetical protein
LFFGNGEAISACLSSDWASIAGRNVNEGLPPAPNAKKWVFFSATSRVVNAPLLARRG